jgi:transposase-like protein
VATLAAVAEPPYAWTVLDFEREFATEAACRAYLEQVRWPDGFRCPACGADRGWRVARGGLWFCAACRRQTSATAGTIFEGTRKPLRMWFRAMWLVTNQKHGVSAMGLQRALGLKSYQTAWAWLQKLRRAMVRPGRDRLSGAVEVDETYVGGVERGVHGRQTLTKAIVAVAVEYDDEGLGRARLRRVADASAQNLGPFVQEAVEPGSLVHTDGWPSYGGLTKLGYRHKVTNLSASGDPAHVLMPGVHRVASLLKRWWLGTHQGAITPEHLDYYLDEFAFRFNRRRSRQRGMLFYRLAQQAVETDPAPYVKLIRPQPHQYEPSAAELD